MNTDKSQSSIGVHLCSSVVALLEKKTDEPCTYTNQIQASSRAMVSKQSGNRRRRCADDLWRVRPASESSLERACRDGNQARRTSRLARLQQPRVARSLLRRRADGSGAAAAQYQAHTR